MRIMDEFVGDSSVYYFIGNLGFFEEAVYGDDGVRFGEPPGRFGEAAWHTKGSFWSFGCNTAKLVAGGFAKANIDAIDFFNIVEIGLPDEIEASFKP